MTGRDCQVCGTPADDGATFCGHCGATLRFPESAGPGAEAGSVLPNQQPRLRFGPGGNQEPRRRQPTDAPGPAGTPVAAVAPVTSEGPGAPGWPPPVPPAAGWPPDPVVPTGPVGWPPNPSVPTYGAPSAQPVVAPGRPAPGRRPGTAALVAILASALVVVLSLVVIVVALARRDEPSASSTAAPGAGTSSGGGAPPGPTASPVIGAPTITKTSEAVNGRDVTVGFQVTPAGGTSTTCQATVNGEPRPVDCAAGSFTAGGLEFASTYDVRIQAAGSGGTNSIQASLSTAPLAATVIHACYPPPCERIKLHASPHRILGEAGPTVYDGDRVNLLCWTQGSTDLTYYDEPGRGRRYTQIFYQLDNQRWIWAPFVTDAFETPIAGVKRC